MLQRVGGCSLPFAGPESSDVRWIDVNDDEAAVAAVGDEVDRIEDSGMEAPSILVATVHRQRRDRLRDEYAFVAWEDRGENAIICETVHRVKGLEFDEVILVVPDEDISDLLLYVGASRAVVGFSLIAPAAVASRLGLT